MESGAMAVVAKIWAWLASIFPMVFGVALYLGVDRKKTIAMTWVEVGATFFFGVGVAYYFSNFVAERWTINPLSATFIAIQVFTAAVGMSIFTLVVENLPVQFVKIVDAIRTKFLGS
jgi:hypothetical protein